MGRSRVIGKRGGAFSIYLADGVKEKVDAAIALRRAMEINMSDEKLSSIASVQLDRWAGRQIINGIKNGYTVKGDNGTDYYEMYKDAAEDEVEDEI